MGTNEACHNCQAMKKQLEEMKQKHFLDFRTIKQKIVSTDQLIKLYQKKCQEFDKQTKLIAELTTKLDGSQRTMDVMGLQLKKSVELSEPLKKTCNELEKEKQLWRVEMQKLQDRVKGSENLVNQLKTVVKEKEHAEEAMRLDIAVQGQRIDEQKKSLKKKDAQITKLKDQMLSEKNGKKEVNKQLTLLRNQLKKMETDVEDSHKMIAELTDKIEVQAKQRNVSPNKKQPQRMEKTRKLFNRVKGSEVIRKPKVKSSPSPPKHSRRTRRSHALEQDLAADGISTEPDSDADVKCRRMVVDEIDGILNVSKYFALSPLPPSPCPSANDNSDSDGSDETEFRNNELGYISDGDDGSDVDGDGGDDDDEDHYNDDLVDHVGHNKSVERIPFQEFSENKDGDNYPSKSVHSAVDSVKNNPTCDTSADALNAMGQADKANILERETESNRSVKEPESSTASKQTPFLMTLRSRRKRRWERPSSESETSPEKSGDNCKKISPVKTKKKAATKEITDRRSCEAQETKTVIEDKPVNVLVDCAETTDKPPRVLNSSGLPNESAVSTMEERIVSPNLNVTGKETQLETRTGNERNEDERQVTACLNRIIDDIVLVEDNVRRQRTILNKATSLGTEFITSTEENSISSETTHEKTDSIREVLDCLNSLIDNVEDKLHTLKSPASLDNDNLLKGQSSKACSRINSKGPIVEAGEYVDSDNIVPAFPNETDRKADLLLPERLSAEDRKDSMVKDEKLSRKGRSVEPISDYRSEESTVNINQELSAMTATIPTDEDAVIGSRLDETLQLLPGPSTPLSPLPDSPERFPFLPPVPTEVFDSPPSLSPIPSSPEQLSSEMDSECEEDSNMVLDEFGHKESSRPSSIPDGRPVTKDSDATAFSNDAEAPSVLDVPNCPSPVSPISSTESRNLRKRVRSSSGRDSPVDQNTEKSGKGVHAVETGDNSKKSPPVSVDPLDRGSDVSEHKYVLWLLTKLENDEITTEELTRRLLVATNLRTFNPLLSALGEILKATTDNVAHALVQKAAVQYVRFSKQPGDQVWEPVISDFETRIVVVLHNLSQHMKFRKLLDSLMKVLGKKLCGLFKSEDNHSAALALCRMYATVCRLLKNGVRVRVLCYDIVRENRLHPLTNQLILSVGLVWPEVLKMSGLSLNASPTILPLNLPSQMFVTTLHGIIMSREIEFPMRVFQQLCGWTETRCKTEALEKLVSELVQILCDPRYVKLAVKPEFGPSLGSEAFECIKCLELLAVTLGWQWTNDVLIRELLWPVLQQWIKEACAGGDDNDRSNAGFISCQSNEISHVSSQKSTLGQDNDGQLNVFDSELNESRCAVDVKVEADSQAVTEDHQAGNCGVSNDEQEANDSKGSCCCLVKNENCSSPVGDDLKMKAKGVSDDIETSVDVANESPVQPNKCHQVTEQTVVSILRLLGQLGAVGLQNEEVDLDSMSNLMCAILTYPDDCREVTFPIQLAAAYASLDILNANPTKTAKVLSDWTARIDKNKEITLPSSFTRNIKSFQTHLSRKLSQDKK